MATWSLYPRIPNYQSVCGGKDLAQICLLALRVCVREVKRHHLDLANRLTGANDTQYTVETECSTEVQRYANVRFVGQVTRFYSSHVFGVREAGGRVLPPLWRNPGFRIERFVHYNSRHAVSLSGKTRWEEICNLRERFSLWRSPLPWTAYCTLPTASWPIIPWQKTCWSLNDEFFGMLCSSYYNNCHISGCSKMVYIVYLYYLFANTSWFQRPVKNFGLNFAPWFLRVETQNSARILFTGMLNNCRLPVVSFFALKAQFYDFWGFFGKFDLEWRSI